MEGKDERRNFTKTAIVYTGQAFCSLDGVAKGLFFFHPFLCGFLFLLFAPDGEGRLT